MNRRTEPRSQVYALVTVARLEDPANEVTGQLLDVSAAGVRIVVDQEFQPEQIVAIETDQHLILAEVRHCGARGARFSVGAERLHAAAKLFLPHSGSRGELIQALIEDYHRRLTDALMAAPAESVQAKMKVAEKIGHVERYEANTAMPPEPNEPFAANAEPTAETPEDPALEREPPAAGVFLLLPNGASAAAVQQEEQEAVAFPADPLAELREAIRDAAVLAEDTPSSPAQWAEPVAAAAAAAETISDGIATVGNMLRDSSSNPPATPVEAAEPALDLIRVAALRSVNVAVPAVPKDTRLRTGVLVTAAVATVVVLGALLFGPLSRKSPTLQSSASAQEAATKAPPVVPAVAPVAVLAAAAAAPTAESAPPRVDMPAVPGTQNITQPVTQHVTLEASDRSWVTACVDGNLTLSKLLVAGGHDDLEFSRNAVVRLGNAGPVRIALNGDSIGAVGTPGQVRVVELTAKGSSFLSGGEPQDCTLTH